MNQLYSIREHRNINTPKGRYHVFLSKSEINTMCIVEEKPLCNHIDVFLYNTTSIKECISKEEVSMTLLSKGIEHLCKLCKNELPFT